MTATFEPDYRHVLDAARNREPARTPLYEHIISTDMMERVMDDRFADLAKGDAADRREFFARVADFWRQTGYDTISFEVCIGGTMPGGGSLGGHKPSEIVTRADFDAYPWERLPDIYWDHASDHFDLLRATMPPGMRAVGGPGNGVFELVCNICAYMDLCLVRTDDPELFAGLFDRIGTAMLRIWERFLEEYGDLYCVCRFGDDLGFKTATLLPPDDIRNHIVPQYRRIIAAIHAAGKPFLWHSCGCNFAVMEDVIAAGIDAKHSNEDVIAPFERWVTDYGDRIGNFGGIDTDMLCSKTPEAVAARVRELLAWCRGHGGFALGSGNSIPAYVPTEGYLAMVEAARSFRGA